MIGRASSSASFLSIAHSRGLRFSGSPSLDCRSISRSTLGVAVAVPVQVRTAAIEYIENRVGIGPSGLQAEAEPELLARLLWVEPLRSGPRARRSGIGREAAPVDLAGGWGNSFATS